ncbi:ABC transporter substrate-binding protein [Actinomycetaceae bacterium UMB8039B]|uniref:ABC transporter substrate-binding protein n=1 Tax=unclassified Pauljensenia TaxID=2908895 RepID=UPI000B05A2DB|nr:MULTISPECIES: ABC transporter substrate-binding protein [unclassified Pauljensenia]MDK7780637.1 ABC transporter substrate-binding protein [Actinomycetaceae bacterium UMB8041B]MDK8293100.1 ABC transporter substrate-binding protein [Actinomycetaceae bacterium UMB8039B]MDK8300188.1 ABC transporter substrate-binding protein [Actinomycetaceae bacterium UMB1218B]MDK8607997.1 ABC transporter substrate-binding protein [Actinomycetaceae bacterium UMB8041A]MDK8752494.1 ABC transporter substrate-bindi
MRRSVRSFSALALATSAALFLSACSGSADTSSESATSVATQSGALETVTPGKLTIATGEPAYSPWVIDNAPESGEGFEAAVAYAVAEELGYSKENVQWTRATFDSSIAPGAKDWDINLQQFSITDERKQAVDFSSPYYTTSQAVVAIEGSAAASAQSIAKLKDVQFGVQAGTTSQQFITNTLGDQLSKQASIYNNSDDTLAALQNGQVDAIVVDLPTAFYMTSAQIDNGVIVGQFEATSDGDDYGIVLPKGSKLTAAVTAAVDSLRDKGTLSELQSKWLSDTVAVPLIK